ncbi:hypothetical protein [Saccharopolyspora erythraea]|uniref:hypothetical protein n=1 Tax=Saccharopolyspora erythraea TaxID=1836 RepID=UPI0020133E21|nr:hypothetical protein [Saccharopolyspora erythraea]
MRRMFWFGAGIAAGVAISRKLGETARKATPTGAAEQLGGAMRELAGAVGSFGADVRAGMSERERELHEVVERADDSYGATGTDDDARRARERRARRAGR